VRLGLGVGLEDEGVEQTEYDGSCDACSCPGSTADKGADEPVFVYSFDGAHTQSVSESGEGNGGACTCKIHDGLIETYGGEEYAGNHEQNEDAGVCEFGAHDEYLPNITDDSTDDKCLYELHERIQSSTSFDANGIGKAGDALTLLRTGG